MPGAVPNTSDRASYRSCQELEGAPRTDILWRCMHALNIYTGYSCISELYSIYFFAFLGWEPLARTGFLFDFAFALGLGSSFSCCSFSFFSSSGSSTGTNVLHICLDARTYICMRVRVSCACVCGMHVFMHMSVCMHARCVNKCMHAYVFVLH